ncbi:MAG: primosomal protein N' [Oscillospiraceae bacterium]|nr:primosomal protein N' [Oscillospiraceae bacterium]
MSKTVKVAVRADSYAYDKPYSYLVPAQTELLPGTRVLVPFGGGNRPVQAIVLDSAESSASDLTSLKTVLRPLDEEPVISEKDLKLLLWMRDKYFCTCYDVLKAMIPVGLDFKTDISFSPAPTQEAEPLPEKSKLKPIYDYIIASSVPVTDRELFKAFPEDEKLGNKLNSLLKKKLILSDRRDVRAMNDKKQKFVRLISLPASARMGSKQTEVLDFLKDGSEYALSEVLYYTGASTATVNSLVKSGVLALREAEVSRLTAKRTYPDKLLPDPELSKEQERVFTGLLSLAKENSPKAALLHGITGSGKTFVYISLIRRVLEMGRKAIVMVPEIALTPQLLDRFIACFGSRVALVHSALSVGERLDEWKRIRNGQADVVVGTRSAIFAPLDNIGLIIMDEEQEYTYRSEQSPKYHARDVAKYRAVQHNSLLLMGSATPSVETMHSALSGKYSLFSLNERFGSAALPKVIFSDMSEELRRGNGGMIGSVLAEELERTFNDGKQAILFLNRRGNSRSLLCRSCGKTVKCPNCSVSLTYHSANNRLMCHYCGHSQKTLTNCPTCQSADLTREGGGTQKAEQELSFLFPDKEIIRMDADTTSGKESHEKLLARFKDENIPMLLGTQMIAKGLDFPNVTLVGVIDADQLLNLPDFRASERAFSMITQAVGRAGRGSFGGRAVIQTFSPNDPVLRAAASQDYTAFYKGEASFREAFRYPPFCELLVLELSGLENSRLYAAAVHVSEALSAALGDEAVFPPAPAPVFRVNNKLRYRIIAKTEDTKQVRERVSAVIKGFMSQRIYNGIGISAVFNPFE